ncbi:MAG: DNA mismatch repair protein MutS [Candidatus Cloacimonetes bacterium]|nr:DNA mismatch repair protein MutS [Candidatus Cloacimonadota bacterium]
MSNKKPTPVMQQFIDVKKLHPDKIILFRMGDFYETFYDDAKLTSKILSITLTSRNKADENAPSLAGFPYHALDSYLDKLVKAGQKVVIVEQLEDPKQAKGLVKRGVQEIITPGAILDDKHLTSKNNNFLASVYIADEQKIVGIAMLDLSTGDFIFTELGLSSLRDELLRQRPSEILVEKDTLIDFINGLGLDYHYTLSVHKNWYYDLRETEYELKKHFHIQTMESIGALNKPNACIAAAAALTYVKELRSEDLKHICSIRYYHLENYMVIDETTRRNLELFLSMRHNTQKGSLIEILDETQTPMGARLLTQYLSYPLINLSDILERQEATLAFRDQIAWTKDLREVLKEIGDLSRIISRLATLRVNPRDLITLANVLESAPLIVTLLHNFHSSLIASLKSTIVNFTDIIDQIRNTILPTSSMAITDGNIIKDGIHSELDELRQICKDGKTWIARLEESEKQSTGITSLKIGFNKVFGYYIEVTNLHKEKIPPNYICKQTLVNCERYISPQLKEHEARVLGAEERIKSIEYEIFAELRKKLSQEVEKLLNYVNVVAQLDVLSNFGFISWQNRYVRPQYNSLGIMEIISCRHPVIEKLLTEERFIPNDAILNDSDNKIALITGPNMAGKSTYLRQIGLCVIMAQIGCFVPADYANIPIFDRVFTRVGASDNLAMGQSTFLVEMIETANILHSATQSSLILLDEIGRGTSTFDGLSLAWAIVEYIHNTSKVSAKTLFATHYHELTELENILHGVKNYNVSVKEWNDTIVFVRKIERGGADKSYGIQVARLAGIPQKVIIRAKEILKNLEDMEISPQGLTAKIKKQLNKNAQVNLYDLILEDTNLKEEKLNSLKNSLLELDINTLSPLQAMQKLVDIRKFILEET